MPSNRELWWPTLLAVHLCGGSAAIPEIEEAVTESAELSDTQLSVLHGTGPQTEISYRLAWSRTSLKAMDLLTNSSRGVWSLTEAGTDLVARAKGLSDAARQKLIFELSATYEKRRRASTSQPKSNEEGSTPETEGSHWKEQLLELLMGISPGGFERLCTRLLREEGFINTRVTGRSGDGGLDGVGVYSSPW